VNDDWPEPVRRVAAVLEHAGADARIEEFEQETPTARDAAKAAGCDLAQIVKTVVFVCDGHAAAALVPGDCRVDARKVATLVGAAGARVAQAQEVIQITGFEPGAVAPFPLPGVRDVLLDSSLLAHDLVWVGAGSTRHLAAIEPVDLVSLSNARAADLVESDAYT
jgi:prolyl-tRNA editing enzyme YbaK/EbsC (Cys-tRNA(Pro) deacylase)